MDVHSRLETIDFVVIGVYAVSVIGLGLWVSYRRRASDDLFLAGRSFGWPSVGLSIFATNVNPSFMIASCGVAYTSGMVAANFDWLAWFFLVLLAMLFVPHYLTTGVSTMPEFMHRRFGDATYRFLSWYTLFTTMILWLGGALYTGALLMSQIMGWPLWVAALVLTVIATSFTVAGGLAAVIVTDVFQALLMIGGSLALTVIAFLQIGSAGNGRSFHHHQLLRCIEIRLGEQHVLCTLFIDGHARDGQINLTGGQRRQQRIKLDGDDLILHPNQLHDGINQFNVKACNFAIIANVLKGCKFRVGAHHQLICCCGGAHHADHHQCYQ